MGEKLRLQWKGKLLVQQKSLLSKSWQSRFCVFLIQSNGENPQIHVFEKESHYEKNVSRDRKIFCLTGTEKLQLNKDKQFGFNVITKKEKFAFAAENQTDYKHWLNTLKQELGIHTIHDPDGSIPSDDEDSDTNLYMDDNVIYESADITPMFMVTIEENDAAQQCNLRGKYFLVVNPHNIALVDRTTKKALFQWPFRYIRRFGKTRTTFQLEAGRKCPSGQGEFTFLTEQGFEIFETFTKTTQKIRSQEDEGASNHLKTSGKSLSKEDGLGTLKRSSKGSPTPVPRRSPDVHRSRPNSDRRSIRSGGNMGTIPDAFASELSNVLKHGKDPEQSIPQAQPSEAPQETLAAKKPDKNAVKKAKKEKEKREKELKEQEKKEQKLREQKAKEMKKNEKKCIKKSVSNAPSEAVGHAYEEVDEVQGRVIDDGPEDLYAEVTDTPVKPMPKPRNEVLKTTPDIYSEPQKIKKDGWKKHATEDGTEPEHEENYDKIKVAATSMKPVIVQGPPNLEDDLDETYDHIGNVKANLSSHNIYGTASGKAIQSVNKAPLDSGYEEAVIEGDSQNASPRVGNSYEEPMLQGTRVILSSGANEEEEDGGYADIS